jgi:hypothetical protein
MSDEEVFKDFKDRFATFSNDKFKELVAELEPLFSYAKTHFGAAALELQKRYGKRWFSTYMLKFDTDRRHFIWQAMKLAKDEANKPCEAGDADIDRLKAADVSKRKAADVFRKRFR